MMMMMMMMMMMKAEYSGGMNMHRSDQYK